MVILEDSILQKGKPAAAGSKILENFIAPFDAEVVSRLKANKIEISTEMTMLEFGMGDVGEIPNGIVLCNDIFGNYRRGAAKQGLCYIRPTYGTVSRYGLIPLAYSMDQIGIICKDPAEGFNILSIIAGKDEKDGAMLPGKSYSYEKKNEQLCASGLKTKLPYSDVYEQVLHILAYAEISNNINRYDGIKFGYRAPEHHGLNELYLNTRTQGFGLETKLAAIMGAMILSQDNYIRYYDKAMRIRRLIKESLPFDEYDILTVSVDSPLAVLAGLPSITFDDVQLIADVGNESALLTAWEGYKS